MSWLLNDLQEALKKYDKLKINKENGTVTGKYEIINPNSNLVLDSFSLIFTFPHNYPNLCLPIVKELERKIPRIADRHVYPDGKLCLTTPINEFLICKKGISFLEFLDDIVGPYLAAQMAISMGWLDGFPQGEYEHGYEGIFQSYSEFFEITDLSIIISGIHMSLKKNQANSQCFCNSGKKLKDCHIKQYRILRWMPKNQLLREIEYLELKNMIDKFHSPQTLSIHL